MNDIIESLTSTTCIIIYIVFILAFIICVAIKKFENNKDKRLQKHNTRELKNLVKEIEKEEKISYEYNDKPVIKETKDELITAIAPSKEQITSEYEQTSKEETLLESMVNQTIHEKEIIEEPTIEIKENDYDKHKDLDFDEDEFVELEYTSIEPTQEEARKELEEITQKLQIEEEKLHNNPEAPKIEEVKKENKNIELTEFEKKQEKESIISLEELKEKAKTIIASNEKTQYDDKDEPISLKEIENKMSKQLKAIKDKFKIETVADKPSQEEIDEMLEGTMPLDPRKVRMDDMNTIKSTYTPTPVISPIYGIENNKNEVEKEREITNLDEELKKSTEFVMSLKELQENLEQ